MTKLNTLRLFTAVVVVAIVLGGWFGSAARASSKDANLRDQATATPDALLSGDTGTPEPTIAPDGTLKTALTRLIKSHTFHFDMTLTDYHAVGDVIQLNKMMHFTLTYSGTDPETKKLGMDGEWIVIINPNQKAGYDYYHKTTDKWTKLDTDTDLVGTMTSLNLLLVITLPSLEVSTFSLLTIGDSFKSVGDEKVGDLNTTHFTYTGDDKGVYDVWLDKASGDIAQIKQANPSTDDPTKTDTVLMGVSAVNVPVTIAAPAVQ
jgi:hypothetical protein